MSDEIGAEITPHFAESASPPAPPPASVIEVRGEELSDDDDESAIEIVDSFEPAEHILETMLPPPLERGPGGCASLDALAEAIAALADVSFDAESSESSDSFDAESSESSDSSNASEPPTERVAPLESGIAPRMPTLMPLARCGPAAQDERDAQDEQDRIENEPPAAPQADDDDYAELLAALVAVASDAGSSGARDALERALDGDPIARAWRAILRGESDDFAACGAASLDEWAAGALAKHVGAPNKASIFRRDLRARGVAAFGIVRSAA